MIKTPLFECLERLLRLREVETHLSTICHTLNIEEYRQVDAKVNAAIGREEVFLGKNIRQWLDH